MAYCDISSDQWAGPWLQAKGILGCPAVNGEKVLARLLPPMALEGPCASWQQGIQGVCGRCKGLFDTWKNQRVLPGLRAFGIIKLKIERWSINGSLSLI